MRLFFRLLAFIALAIAVIAAVVDASRSLSAGAILLTSLASGWSSLAPQSLAATDAFIRGNLPGVVHDPAFAFLLAMPAAAVFAVLAALFYALGARRERPFGEIRMR